MPDTGSVGADGDERVVGSESASTVKLDVVVNAQIVVGDFHRAGTESSQILGVLGGIGSCAVDGESIFALNRKSTFDTGDLGVGDDPAACFHLKAAAFADYERGKIQCRIGIDNSFHCGVGVVQCTEFKGNIGFFALSGADGVKCKITEVDGHIICSISSLHKGNIEECGAVVVPGEFAAGNGQILRKRHGNIFIGELFHAAVGDDDFGSGSANCLEGFGKGSEGVDAIVFAFGDGVGEFSLKRAVNIECVNSDAAQGHIAVGTVVNIDAFGKIFKGDKTFKRGGAVEVDDLVDPVKSFGVNDDGAGGLKGLSGDAGSFIKVDGTCVGDRIKVDSAAVQNAQRAAFADDDFGSSGCGSL